MDQHNNKKFGLINKGVIKMVPPLRQTIINDFQKDIRNGKFSKSDVPMFKEFVRDDKFTK
jgi:hypothetical protein